MNILTRRIAAATTLIAAPALIALGVASGAQADTSLTSNGPSVSAPAKPEMSFSPTTTATPWQPRTHHERRHYGQRRHFHHNIFVN